MKTATLHDVLIGVMGESQFKGVGFHPCQSHLDGLLEDVTELAGQLDTAISRHISNFDE